jgi:hypothetical protein
VLGASCAPVSCGRAWRVRNGSAIAPVTSAPCVCVYGGALWRVQVRVSMQLFGVGNATVAHIHGGPGGFAGVAAPLTTIPIATSAYLNGVFIIPPASASCTTLLSGNAYLNVHTEAHPAGMT